MLYNTVEELLRAMQDHVQKDHTHEYSENDSFCNIYVPADEPLNLIVGYLCDHKHFRISTSNVLKPGNKWANMFKSHEGRLAIARRCGKIDIDDDEFRMY